MKRSSKTLKVTYLGLLTASSDFLHLSDIRLGWVSSLWVGPLISLICGFLYVSMLQERTESGNFHSVSTSTNAKQIKHQKFRISVQAGLGISPLSDVMCFTLLFFNQVYHRVNFHFHLFPPHPNSKANLSDWFLFSLKQHLPYANKCNLCHFEFLGQVILWCIWKCTVKKS